MHKVATRLATDIAPAIPIQSDEESMNQLAARETTSQLAPNQGAPQYHQQSSGAPAAGELTGAPNLAPAEAIDCS